MARHTSSWMVASLLVVAAPAGVAAQGVFDMGALTNTLSLGGVIQSEQERTAREGRSGRGAERPPASARPAASSRFNADPARRRANLGRFVERVRTSDPQGSASLVAFLTGQDVFGIMGRGMQPYGLRLDDLADATTVYLAAAWFSTRGRNDDPTSGQMAGLRRQISQALSASPEMARASGAARQEIADATILQAAVIAAVLNSAQGDAARLAELRRAVAAGARSTYGIDLLMLDLSDVGLRPMR